MKTTPSLILILLLTACTANKKKDPLGQWLAAPEEIVKQKNELGLEATQVLAIEGRYRKSKPAYDSVKIVLSDRVNEMEKILQQHPVNEVTAQEKLSEILVLENRLKTLQLSVYVFSKNQLTKEQFKKLKK